MAPWPLGSWNGPPATLGARLFPRTEGARSSPRLSGLENVLLYLSSMTETTVRGAMLRRYEFRAAAPFPVLGRFSPGYLAYCLLGLRGALRMRRALVGRGQ